MVDFNGMKLAIAGGSNKRLFGSENSVTGESVVKLGFVSDGDYAPCTKMRRFLYILPITKDSDFRRWRR